MARQQRKMEGDENERRRAAREARAQGELPSARGATLGASKQRESVGNAASHQEKMDTRHEGKQAHDKAGERPRPGNRAVDPKRTDDRE